MTALTYAELERQLLDCNLLLVQDQDGPSFLEVVIRTADGDYELCACHREGVVLILDMGQRRPDASLV